MEKDLTQGSVIKTMLLFAGPMILGNLLQQCYNIADTLIVGRYLGSDALAGVGSAYTLMTFLNSVIIGLCMGSGSVFSVCFGKNDRRKMKDCMAASFLFIAAVTIVINVLAFAGISSVLHILQVPAEVYGLMKEYVRIIFCGIFFVFLYNYFAFLLRGIGNSVVPLYFLGIAAILNISLDLLFVVVFNMGVAGAALATVIAQAVSGIGIAVYVWVREPELRPGPENYIVRKKILAEIVRHSTAACIQQSVIDSIAYMPAQEFGNAFSLFVSQNHGGGKKERVREAIRQAVKISTAFCLMASAVIFVLAPYLMRLFVTGSKKEIIGIGADYLRIEGSFYCGIGILFLLYGFCRGIEKPEMSLVLTIISLGTRVLLAYMLSSVSSIGVLGIWWSIPVGWFLADLAGMFYIRKQYKWKEEDLTTG